MLDFNKKVVLITLLILILAFLVVVLAVVFQQPKGTDYRTKILGEKEALLIVDYGQGKERWFKGEIVKGMTLGDVLQTSSQAGNFNFAANTHLTFLDGLANNQEKKWRCYINDQEIAEVFNRKIIFPQDKILCRYQ